MVLRNPAKIENGIISSPRPPYDADPRGLGCVIYDKMVEHGEYVCQIDAITGEEDTHGALLERCIRTAIVMRSRNVSSNDVITICSYNHINSCIPYLAGLFVGAKLSCLDPTLSLSETVHLIGLIQPKITFVGPEAVKLIEDATEEAGVHTEIVVFGDSAVHTQFSEYLKPSRHEKTFQPSPANNVKDTAVIFFSAGTTGMPKGVCMSHDAILCQIHHFVPIGAPVLKLIMSYLTFASLYWISSVMMMLICIYTNRARIIYPMFDVDAFWGVLRNAKVNVVFLTPSQVQSILQRGRPRNGNTPHLLVLIIIGGTMSKELVLEVKRLMAGINVINVYGLAEAGGYTTSFRPYLYMEDHMLMKDKPESCGKPQEGIACKIVDNETGEILGPYQRGELRVKTDFQMTGYLSMDSSSAFDADGWLKSGDVAYYDEDNCYYIVDRMNEMLKFRSWHVAPSKIEGVLHSHPAIENAVVVGLPHPEDGQHPVGVVVLRRSAADCVTAEDIEHYVEQRVDDRYKLRGGVRIVNYIPITPEGKIRRRDMRELVLQGRI